MTRQQQQVEELGEERNTTRFAKWRQEQDIIEYEAYLKELEIERKLNKELDKIWRNK